MIDLGRQSIQLNAQAHDEPAAIRLAAGLLVANGNMQPGYIDSMLQREQVANIYLGNGIAIPHGMPKDRELIRRTGIAVAQFPAGVTWNNGETVHLVVAIAARSDEHIELLRNLTDVLGDEAAMRQLAATRDADDIVARLTRPRQPAAAAGPAEDEGFTRSVDIVGRSGSGLHARPATALVEIAQRFQCEIRVRHGDKVPNGKSLVAVMAQDPQHEPARLAQAIAAARAQLHELHDEVKARSGAARAAIFRAHEAFLDDPDLHTATLQRIELGHSAGWAWRETVDERSRDVAALGDPLLKERAVDLQDVGRRVLRLLADAIEEEPELPDSPVILMADDLSPSDTAKLDPRRVLGLCTAAGGPTSHTAIIARSLGIPAITTDGHRVEVVANIGAAAEAAQAVDAGAEGIGLMRTEFLFLQRDEPPSEQEQFEAYRAMTQALNGLPLIIRTLDIGGDKEMPYLSLPAEANPFLGVRDIRLCLARPDLFKPQLRAIYRASMTGPVKIMFPMIATREELVAARALAEDVRRELGAEPVDIGIMVEVPSAALMAGTLARDVDFFSVGTNDLTQYAMAMDRGHPSLARQADGLHPAVLRPIQMTVQAASAAGKWVGVCGGIAGDPRGAAILTGLGVTELSMSIPSVAAVKAHIRGLSLARAQALAQRALACETAAEMRGLQ